MKMKLILSGFLVIACLISSCNPDDALNNGKNYWEQNTLVRMKLKGKVKTLTEKNYQTIVTQFNENGFISSVSMSDSNSTQVASYSYMAGGELYKIETANTGATTASSTVAYEYDTHGKYVATFPMHLFESGLVANLKAVIYKDYRQDYKFVGDDLLIISTNTIQNFKDTSIIKYNGNYPQSASSTMHFMKDITYADNGMFKTYTEGFTGPNYSDARIYTFKTDAEYLLKESVRNVYVNGTETREETEIFTYNDKKDLIKYTRGTANETNIVYEYDSQNNWTKRTTTSIYEGSTMPITEVVTRSIVYWP